MNGRIQEPVKGTSFASITSWAREVTRAVNGFAPIASPGMLAREGGAGFGAEPAPVNRRDRRGASAARVIPGAGCFAIAEHASATSTSYGEIFDCAFVNQYYMIGQVPYLAAFAQGISSLVGVSVSGPDGNDEFTATLATPIVALKITATGQATAALQAYTDFAALQSASRDTAFCIVPLYVIAGTTETYYADADTGHEHPLCRVKLVVDADLRNAPRAQMTEIV